MLESLQFRLSNYFLKWDVAAPLVYTVAGIAAVGAITWVFFRWKRKGEEEKPKNAEPKEQRHGKPYVNEKNILELEKQIKLQEEAEALEQLVEEEDVTTSEPKQHCIGGRVDDPFLFAKLANSLKETESGRKDRDVSQPTNSSKITSNKPLIVQKAKAENESVDDNSTSNKPMIAQKDKAENESVDDNSVKETNVDSSVADNACLGGELNDPHIFAKLGESISRGELFNPDDYK